MSVKFCVILLALIAAGKADIHGVRLRGGSTSGQGKVEVKRGRQWGAVCDDHWTMNEAKVVCRQLGYKHALHALKTSSYGNARGPIWIKGVRCQGHEPELSKCAFDEISKVRTRLYQNTDEIKECSYAAQASVVCAEPPNPHEDLIQLGDPVPSSGPSHQHSRLVTLKVNGRWYPICAGTWTSREASVACRQAGLGFAKLTETISAESHDIDQYSANLKILRCRTHEQSLQQCGITVKNAGCKDYASVICMKDAPDISVNITELEASIGIRHKQENNLVCAMEEKCLSHSGLKKSAAELKASKSTRRLLEFSTIVQNFGTADFRPPQLERGWHYHKCHKHYHSMMDFSKYELRDVSRQKVIEAGQKVSFCLRDSSCVEKRDKKYGCSGKQRNADQGISVGCRDIYSKTLDCQWIDVTDVADGNYTLEIHTNPFLLVSEQDYSNNFIVCNITIQGRKARGHNCHSPSDFVDYVPANGP